MNKMVINHLERLFVTSDASTITQELEVQHPAAKLLVMAAQAQQQEIGDATNLVRDMGGAENWGWSWLLPRQQTQTGGVAGRLTEALTCCRRRPCSICLPTCPLACFFCHAKPSGRAS